MIHENEIKYLSVSRVKDLLDTIPEDYVLSPNDVGNMAIYKINNDGFKFHGFIDFIPGGGIEI